MRVFSDKNRLYSVDMMIAYVNLFPQKEVIIRVADYDYMLDHNCWGVTEPISPRAVMLDKSHPEYEKIEAAKLRYPVFVYKKWIIDGMHRLAKASLQNKKTLKAIVFDEEHMKRFYLGGRNKEIDTHTLIEKFWVNFHS